MGGIVVFLTLTGLSGAEAQQPVLSITDKISGLAGMWARDASRGTGGICGVSEEVYVLNRDRSELTLWRTLNVRMPDDTSGKIDCGNRAAVVYRRQAAP
jgi:hypothetical protein